MKLIHYKHII